jgi:hypothetical protein
MLSIPGSNLQLSSKNAYFRLNSRRTPNQSHKQNQPPRLFPDPRLFLDEPTAPDPTPFIGPLSRGRRLVRSSSCLALPLDLPRCRSSPLYTPECHPLARAYRTKLSNDPSSIFLLSSLSCGLLHRSSRASSSQTLGQR